MPPIQAQSTLADTTRPDAETLTNPHDQRSGDDAPNRPYFRFDLPELSGSLGDLGTFLPLSLAMALTCGLDLGVIFIFAGLMNLATGLLFRQPIPVQPMKAIAAVAVAEGLSPGAIAAAGWLTGAAVLALAMAGGVDWIARIIPKPVVRGIQAGVGVKLAWTGLQWLAPLPPLGWDSRVVAVLVGTAVILSMGRRGPVLLGVFALGLLLTGLEQFNAIGGGSTVAHPSAGPTAEPAPTLPAGWPAFALVLPEPAQWWIGFTRGAIPQLPLTLLNSVIAVCALSEDYFPGRGASPRRMAASVGMMNLLCLPLGAMPMCHGAGGLAAQYRFGARTGGSVLMLGALKIVAGCLLGGVLITGLQSFPRSILAVMVVAAGATLARAASDAMRGRPACIVAAMVATIVLVNTLAGFVVGCAVAAGLALLERGRADGGGGPPDGRGDDSGDDSCDDPGGDMGEPA